MYNKVVLNVWRDCGDHVRHCFYYEAKDRTITDSIILQNPEWLCPPNNYIVEYNIVYDDQEFDIMLPEVV